MLAEPGRAVVAVHDVRGRLIRTLVDRPRTAGAWSIEWDGRDEAGYRLPSGTYLVNLRLDGRLAEIRKVVLVP